MKSNTVFLNILLLLLFISTEITAQSLVWLGTLGGESSDAYAVSNDGSVVIGQIINSSGEPRAVKWTSTSGLEILNGLQNIYSWATAVSSDGNIVVGTAQENVRKAFRCIQDNPFEYLAPLGGADFNTCQARDLSADGSQIVGVMTNLSDEVRGFIWSESTGMIELSALQFQDATAEVSAVSGDGDLLVGRGSFSDSVLNYSALPVEWITLTTYNIRTLPYFLLMEYGVVEEVSENGDYAVGEFMINGKLRGQRWHREPPGIWSPYTDVGLLDGIPDSVGRCYALDVSNDGSVVGQTTDSSPEGMAAYLWEKTSFSTYTMFNLNELYSNLINQSGYLISAHAITPDGRFIVGRGYRLSTHKYEAFVLDRGPSTNVDNQINLLFKFNLEQNYPNPFNPSTRISFSIPKEDFVTLKVYNSLGEEVEELIDETKPAGNYSISFNAGQLPSGIYFYKLSAGNYFQTRKMILVK